MEPISRDPYVASKALFQLEKLQELRLGHPIAPTMIQVDPEAYCNDNCSFCSYREEEMYNTEMLKLIDAKPSEVKKMGPVGKPTAQSGWPLQLANTLPEMMVEAGIAALEITGGGEPTIWAGFDSLVENSIRLGIEVGVVTNASNISLKRANLLAKCTWVRFSIDAPNEIIHQKIHRTPKPDFNRRIENIAKVVQQKQDQRSDCTLGISYVITPQNIDYIEEMCRMSSDLTVDNLRFSFMYDKTGKAGLTDEQYEALIPKLQQLKEKYSTPVFAILYDGTRLWTYSKPNTDFKKCYLQQFIWAIGADCKVYPCCIMKYIPGFDFADIREKTLKEIINDVEFQARQNNLKPTGCFPCWLRSRNQAIAQTQVEPMHKNFL